MEYYRGMLLANVAWGGADARPGDLGRHAHADRVASATAGRSSSTCGAWTGTSARIELFVDDRLLNDVDLSRTINQDGSGMNPFHQPHLIILNLAVGGTGGDPAQTTFPARYEIDYVRVYQRR